MPIGGGGLIVSDVPSLLLCSSCVDGCFRCVFGPIKARVYPVLSRCLGTNVGATRTPRATTTTTTTPMKSVLRINRHG